MLPQHVLIALVVSVSAVPLNINLGAYSPALVVGDGEISLGSSESASTLMATLASGAANGNGGEQAQGRSTEASIAARAAPAPVVRTIDHLGKRAPAPEEGLEAVQEAMAWIKRDLPGFREALGYAREAMQNQPKVEMGTEKAGVGMIINAGLKVPVNSAANGVTEGGEKKARRVRRSEVVEEDSAPSMTLIAITEV
ncbi:hypothetical protein P154DRAFT_423739 [Amniculicola lignicola CBS 123094]|uniref:Uncharacterized protein n=1 Tax=Amniculicola lignicola CBS 123094 TaxID=1392246 RepID=A0A6A5WVE4_9PLEO|nr:hypothetical protein P154DRAFT_423739 [Amniculicola lignicola CBS 123094]